MMSPAASRTRSRRVVFVIAVAVVLVGCAVASMAFMPAYWYMIADAMPQSFTVPSSIRRSSSSALDSTGSSQDGNVTTTPAQTSEVPVPVRDDVQDQARQEVQQTGHGLAVVEHWRQRQPHDISDDSIQEDQYLLTEYATPATTYTHAHTQRDGTNFGEGLVHHAAGGVFRERMRQIADKDGYIMVTWANDHYFDFVSNWVHHVERLGISAFVVGAMDSLILGKLGRKKIKLVQLFTEMNLTVIISDVDTVWMRNPFEYFKRYPEADILTSTDFVAWTHGDEGLEDAARAGSAYNIGIMMFSPKSARFAKEWVEVIEGDEKIWDQNAFNDLAKRGMQLPRTDSDLAQKRLFLGDNGNLVMGILPSSIFANGHTFFVTRVHEQLGLAPFVVHATFQFSGTPGKRNRMRERLLWRDPPEYYDPGHGWVAWDMDVPGGLLAAAAPAAPSLQCCEQQKGHFDLVNHQLLQLRSGLAVASVLGLGIVIPQFMAGQDRYWAPHSGLLPGSKMQLPFRAPLDHILNLENSLGHSKPVEEAGPDIPFREYSFLSNPALPAATRDSQITVNICEEKLPHCSDGSAAAVEHEGALWIMQGLDDLQLRSALGTAAQAYKVLKFSVMAGAFSRHQDDADHARFVRRTTPMASLWCCVMPPPGEPGHIWYDLWWDTIPHKDQHEREWTEPWSMLLGP